MKDKQLERRIQRLQRRLASVDNADRRERVERRLKKAQELLAMPEADRPAPVKVTLSFVQLVLKGAGTVLPPPVGPLLVGLGIGIDGATKLSKAVDSGDQEDVFDELESTLKQAMKEAGVADHEVTKLVPEVLDALDDAIEKKEKGS